MNSSTASPTKSTTARVEAQRTSTWIERVTIPLAASSMEAQPIALAIALLTLMVTKDITASPIGAGGIALVALGLLWWAMLVEHSIQCSPRGRRMAWLHFLGWLVTFVLIAGSHIPSLVKGESIPAVLIDLVLVTWFWRRGMQRAQTGFEYGQVATSFKAGFGVLLGILTIVILLPAAELQALRDALGSSLPVFFLSGLVGLSLVRLGAIRNARRSLDSGQADPTRSWLLALTLFGVTLIAIVIIIESIFSFRSFELVVTALTPLWDALGILVGWVLYGIIFIVLAPIFYLISFLIGLFTNHASSQQPSQNPGPRQSPFQQPWHPQAIPPELLALGRWLFLALVAIVVLLIVPAMVRQWYTRSNEESVEEVREGLDARSLLGQRWREWWSRRRARKNAVSPLEPLDPTSARARYREMLQAVTTAKGELARYPAETPTEYEARLLRHLRQEVVGSTDLASQDDMPSDSAILDELTHAYLLERYGGKCTDNPHRAFLQVWVPGLIARLTGRVSTYKTKGMMEK